jgi:hypothetical protein
MNLYLAVFSNINFWLIWIGLSYLIMIPLARDWAMKNFKMLLIVAVLIFLIGNVVFLMKFKSKMAVGILNCPLITLLTYKLLYKWFQKKYKKPPVSPMDTFYSWDFTLFREGILNFVFLMTSISLSILLTIAYIKWI